MKEIHILGEFHVHVAKMFVVHHPLVTSSISLALHRLPLWQRLSLERFCGLHSCEYLIQGNLIELN